MYNGEILNPDYISADDREILRRGSDAEALMAHPVFQRVFTELQAQYHVQIFRTPPGPEHDKIFYQHEALQMILAELTRDKLSADSLREDLEHQTLSGE